MPGVQGAKPPEHGYSGECRLPKLMPFQMFLVPVRHGDEETRELNAFISAARAVAEQVTDSQLASGLIYPHQSRILEASLHTAVRVAETLFDEGVAGVPRPADIGAFVRGFAYKPVYPAGA
jgi:hypothetical protein